MRYKNSNREWRYFTHEKRIISGSEAVLLDAAMQISYLMAVRETVYVDDWDIAAAV